MIDTLTQDIITSILAYLLTIISFTSRNLVTLFIYSYENYPQFTQFIIIIIGIYILYKFTLSMIKIWINLFISVMKTLVVLSTISFITLLYFRGWNKLIYQDLPYFKPIFFNFLNNLTSSSSLPSWLSFLLKNSDKLNQDNFKSTFENLNKEDIDSYFSYFEQNFNNQGKNDFTYDQIHDFVNKGFDHLEKSGIDWSNLGSNVLQFLNQNQNRN